jgi:hypothetical protein
LHTFYVKAGDAPILFHNCFDPAAKLELDFRNIRRGGIDAATCGSGGSLYG